MSRLRVVSYAINGRGMGHLVRQLALLRWIRRLAAVLERRVELWILTSSEADTLARREGIPALKMPSKAMLRDAGIEPARVLRVARGWVLQTVAGLAPDLLLVDTFPGGSFGELVPVLELAERRVLIARQVRQRVANDAAYAALLPLYDAALAPEETGHPVIIRERAELMERADARRALGIPDGRRAVYVTLGGGGDVAAASLLPSLIEQLSDWHVVVGAGPLYDGPEVRGPGITWIDRYVPIELFPGLDAAVSAGGYNSFHELMFAGVPAVFLPQPRISDDQAARVQRAVDAGAGLLAQHPGQVAALLDQLPAGAAQAAQDLVPDNGARHLAARVLSVAGWPQDDLDQALGVLDDTVLRFLHAAGPTQHEQALSLIRLLAGPSPTRRRQDRARLLALADAHGVEIPAARPGGPAGARVRAYLSLTQSTAVPLDMALSLTRGLARKFPLATPDDLVAACGVLFPVWAGFGDWMGALSLLRAMPTQRTYAIADFARDTARWLQGQDDLFDALRDFSRLEGKGATPVAGVLRQLLDAP